MRDLGVPRRAFESRQVVGSCCVELASRKGVVRPTRQLRELERSGSTGMQRRRLERRVELQTSFIPLDLEFAEANPRTGWCARADGR
ncbi:MAG: hypothetical protein U0263_23040 [Polyangiaceae bacterium]